MKTSPDLSFVVVALSCLDCVKLFGEEKAVELVSAVEQQARDSLVDGKRHLFEAEPLKP